MCDKFFPPRFKIIASSIAFYRVKRHSDDPDNQKQRVNFQTKAFSVRPEQTEPCICRSFINTQQRTASSIETQI